MSRHFARTLGAVALFLAACSAEPEPSLRASLFGHTDVTFTGDFASLGTLQEVVVGGIRTYDLRTSEGGVTITLQGSPKPGIVDVELRGTAGARTLQRALAYDAPTTGVPLKWVAFGASLTLGTQSRGVEPHSQLHGPAALLARSAGVYLGLPLLHPAFTPELKLSDLNPDCSTKPGAGVSLEKILGALIDPETGDVNLKLARVDWTLFAMNIAVGGVTIDELLNGSEGVHALLERIVQTPEHAGGDYLDRMAVSQIDQIERRDPDIGISTDLLGNDVQVAVTQSDDVHPELITPVEEARPTLEQVAQRLGKLRGHYFIANMPSPSLLGIVDTIRQKRIAAGEDTAESFAAKTKLIDERTAALNEALAQALAPYPNLHLVDFRSAVETIHASGVKVGTEELNTATFDGLTSLDHLHFTDTGNALVANLFAESINQVLGSRIPPIDLEAVHAADPISPARLRAAGLTCRADVE